MPSFKLSFFYIANVGFEITVVLNMEFAPCCSDAKCCRHLGFTLPFAAKERYADLLDALDAALARAGRPAEYTLEMTSLEEVFLRLCEPEGEGGGADEGLRQEDRDRRESSFSL